MVQAPHIDNLLLLLWCCLLVNCQDAVSKPAAKPVAESKPCPEDRQTLGRATWSFLHTMAAYYPDKPTDKKQKQAKEFLRLFSHLYPCDDCKEHLQVW